MATSKPSTMFIAIFIIFTAFPSYFAEDNSTYGYPNIIIFLTDNLSLGDLNYYGRNSQQTPNIDRLIDEGVVFSRWYSQSSGISSRAAILTGLLPPRTGMIRSKFLPFKEIPSVVSSGGLQHKEITLAEVLKGKGYSTTFIGLWDLGLGKKGQYLPINQGFDSWYGVPSVHKDQCLENYKHKSNQNYSSWGYVRLFLLSLNCGLAGVSCIVFRTRFNCKIIFLCHAILAVLLYLAIDMLKFVVDFIHTRSCVLYMDSNIVEQPYTAENMTLRFTRKAVTFVEKSSKSNKPFFMFVSFMKLNHPIIKSNLFTNSSSKQSVFSDALCELDWSIGRIMKTLKEQEVDDNTLILFTSSTGRHVDESCYDCRLDNAIKNLSWGDVYLRGTSKNDVWEGTIRVPAVIRWKRQLAGRQRVSSLVTIMDVMPTVLELLNYTADALDSDGRSLLPVLFNSSAESLHEFVFHYLDVIKPAAVSFGPYKAVFIEIKDNGGVQAHDPPLLFNVDLDPGETLPLPPTEYSKLQANISTALEQHMATRKNKWHSQLDSPFVPYYFPCANFPNCFQATEESEDFTDLFQ